MVVVTFFDFLFYSKGFAALGVPWAMGLAGPQSLLVPDGAANVIRRVKGFDVQGGESVAVPWPGCKLDTANPHMLVCTKQAHK